MMKFSKFNYILQHQSKFYVYNSLTDALFLFNHPFDEEHLKLFSETELQQLLQNGLLVTTLNEELLTNSLLKRNNTPYIINPPFKHFVLTPSLSCNARCAYCYEENVQPKSMSSETIAQTIKFIINNTTPNNTVRISWFGGEPTL